MNRWAIVACPSGTKRLRRMPDTFNRTPAIQTVGEGLLNPRKNHLFGRTATPLTGFFTLRRTRHTNLCLLIY